MVLARSPMERTKATACPKSRPQPGCPRRLTLRNGSGASEGHFFFLPTFLMPQGQTLLAGTPLPFNSVEGSNMQTHKGDLLHAASPSLIVPVLLQHHPPAGRSQLLLAHGQKQKKILSLIAVGAELKLPLRHGLTALTCLLLTSVGNMTTLLV